MTIRDGIARRLSGGPRFRVQPDRILVEVEGPGYLGDAHESLSNVRPDGSRLELVRAELEDVGLDTKVLDNSGIIVAKAERLETVLDGLNDARDYVGDTVRSELDSLRQKAQSGLDRTFVGGYSTGNVDGAVTDSEIEARLRNELTDVSLHNTVTDAIESIEGVLNVEMTYTRTTFGPRSLNLDPANFDVVDDIVYGEEGEIEKPTLDDVLDDLNIEGAWEIDTGEGAVLAVFDTAFCKDQFDEDRVIDTFHGESVDSAFSDDEMEGHGSMTGVAAGGNADLAGIFDGPAKDADLLLARLSNDEGALAYTEEAWDWLAGKIEEFDRPIISNHSYGIPLCGAEQMNLCDSTSARLVRELNQRDDHQAVYAAGNEGMYCGHRLSGVTNGINGENSDQHSLTVGALRADGREAQRYSSHGFGTCTDVRSDPKPNVSCAIPPILPYACESKDMSTGVGGSGGGTSTAAPITAGIATLIASATGSADTEMLKEALEETAELPRKTQVNIFRGYDARFGHGQVQPVKALEYALDYEE